MRFAQNLESVADSHHIAAIIGKADNAFHYRRKTRDRAATKVITVREAARYEDKIAILQVFIFMPKSYCFISVNIFEYVNSIMVAVRAGENNNTEFHSAKLVISFLF